MMGLPDLPPRRRRRTAWAHALILGVVTASLAIFVGAEDEIRGKAAVSDAFAFTLAFVPVAYIFGWLPSIWRRTGGTAFEPIVTPMLLAMVLVYLYFAFRSLFIQPAAAGTAVGLQILALILLSCRLD